MYIDKQPKGDRYNQERKEFYKQFVQKLIDSKILEFVEMKE